MIPTEIDILVTNLTEEPTYAAIAAAVLLLGIARVHASPRWFCPDMAVFWNPLRRYLWPLADHALARVPGPFFAKTRTTEDEVSIDGLEISLDDLTDDLCGAGYEVQPLASIARFDPRSSRPIAGEYERASLARFHGGQLGESILPAGLLDQVPEWLLARRQTHIRPYGPDGSLVVTAHEEFNPWNPAYAVHHLLGVGIDVEAGVRTAREDLGVAELVDGDEESDDQDEGLSLESVELSPDQGNSEAK